MTGANTLPLTIAQLAAKAASEASGAWAILIVRRNSGARQSKNIWLECLITPNGPRFFYDNARVSPAEAQAILDKRSPK